MDPTTALENILEAIEQDDYQEAGPAAAALLAWIGAGGFLPDMSEEQRRRILRWWLAKVISDSEKRAK